MPIGDQLGSGGIIETKGAKSNGEIQKIRAEICPFDWAIR